MKRVSSLLKRVSKPVLVFTVEMAGMNLLGRKVVIFAPSTECSVSSHTFGSFSYCTFEMLHYSLNLIYFLVF